MTFLILAALAALLACLPRSGSMLGRLLGAFMALTLSTYGLAVMAGRAPVSAGAVGRLAGLRSDPWSIEVTTAMASVALVGLAMASAHRSVPEIWPKRVGATMPAFTLLPLVALTSAMSVYLGSTIGLDRVLSSPTPTTAPSRRSTCCSTATTSDDWSRSPCVP